MSATHNSSWFERFMASGYGRIARGGLGLAIIATALLLLDGTLAIAVATLGLIPVAAGVLNLCPVAPLWGGHFIGARYCGTRTDRTD
jgi:membrane-associated protease RseP (regulator of RpoE activity)